MGLIAHLLIATLAVAGGSGDCDDVQVRAVRDELLQQPELDEGGARFLTIHGNTVLVSVAEAVSYTHLTLPTNREV